MKKNWSVGIAVALGVGLLLVATWSRGTFSGSVPQLAINLSQPDALIQSRQLSALPRDLVAQPALGQVLTSDFVNYYEEHPERLSLEGSLRRLAFEHGLTWQDKLLSTVLDAPAELALWRDGKGRLAYAALSLEKNAAASALEQLGKVVLPDQQLSHAGTVQIDGKSATVFALRVSGSSTWLWVSSGTRLLVFTHPGMLLNADGKLASKSTEAIIELLKTSKATEPTPWQLDMAKPTMQAATQHAITAKASWLSFGYQHFFPDLHALRIDLSRDQSLRVAVAAAPTAWPVWPASADAAWRVVPRGAALCAALPVQWDQSRSLLDDQLGKEGSKALLADLEPGAAVCWYAAQGLYAPTLALKFKPGTAGKHDALLKKLLEKSVKTPKGKPALVAIQRVVNGHTLWSAQVPTPYGYLRVADERVFRVSMLRRGDSLLASPDHRAMDQALAVASKTYPALSDDFSHAPLIASDLPELARLLQAESQRLTQSTPAFQALVRTRLKPRLDAMGQNGRLTISSPNVSNTKENDKKSPWVWQALALSSAALPGGAPSTSKSATPTAVR